MLPKLIQEVLDKQLDGAGINRQHGKALLEAIVDLIQNNNDLVDTVRYDEIWYTDATELFQRYSQFGGSHITVGRGNIIYTAGTGTWQGFGTKQPFIALSRGLDLRQQVMSPEPLVKTGNITWGLNENLGNDALLLIQDNSYPNPQNLYLQHYKSGAEVFLIDTGVVFKEASQEYRFNIEKDGTIQAYIDGEEIDISSAAEADRKMSLAPDYYYSFSAYTTAGTKIYHLGPMSTLTGIEAVE